MITPEEQEIRRRAVSFNRSNARLEGTEPPPEAIAVEERYIRGELDDDGLRTELLKLAAAIASKTPHGATWAKEQQGEKR